MRLLQLLILALLLSSPALMSAQAEDHESAGHEAAEVVAEEVADDVAVATGGHGEHGADAGHGELSFSSLIRNREFQGTLFNFVVLVLLIGWVIRTKANPIMAERRKEVEKELAEAQRLRAEAEARHRETASRLEKLDQEMLAIRGEMIKAGEAERDRIVEQAEEKAARMRKDTSFLIDQQIKQLRKDLSQQAANAAVLAAQTLLQGSTNDADQDQLAEAYLNRLDEVLEERQS